MLSPANMNRSLDPFAWQSNAHGYHARRGNHNSNYFAGHSNSVSPVRPPPNHATYHFPQPFPQVTHRRKQVLDFTNHNYSTAVPRGDWNGQNHLNGMNGGGPHGHFGLTAPQHQYSQEMPYTQLSFSTYEERQRYAQDLMEALNVDKKQVLAARQRTAGELKRLKQELETWETTQAHQENLRVIYPLQAELAGQQKAHDEYGRHWDTLSDLIEMLWSEMMVPNV
ncbi:MAG: hypothetical protein Q9203_006870 [Teloschistes exilis]